MTDKKDFVKKLRVAMKREGISAYKLSQAVKVAPASIQHILKERNLPKAGLLAELCKTLNLSSDYLLGLKTKERE